MESLIFFLVLCQALGACVGVVSVVRGEFAYVRAMRDGKVTHAERAHLDHIARGLLFGMSLLLISSLALVVVAYALHTAQQPARMANYWILIVLALLIIIASWALSHKHISFAFGSAIAFTGWWFLAFLTFGQIPPLSFGAAAAFFVVATGIFYVLLQYARMLTHPKR